MEGISSLKGDKFRKKTLSSKKAIIQSVIKSIHIKPDNVIRIDLDVWGSKKTAPVYDAGARSRAYGEYGQQALLSNYCVIFLPN